MIIRNLGELQVLKVKTFTSQTRCEHMVSLTDKRFKKRRTIAVDGYDPDYTALKIGHRVCEKLGHTIVGYDRVSDREVYFFIYVEGTQHKKLLDNFEREMIYN